jgi:hypothetical protein
MSTAATPQSIDVTQLGRELPKLARHGQRIEEQQPLPLVDRVGRHVLAPRLGRPPLWVRCLPVP